MAEHWVRMMAEHYAWRPTYRPAPNEWGDRASTLREVVEALEEGFHPQNPSGMHPADYVRLHFKLDGHEGLRNFAASETEPVVPEGAERERDEALDRLTAERGSHDRTALALRDARRQTRRLLDAIAHVGRPPWTNEQAQRVFDVANEIARETSYAV